MDNVATSNIILNSPIITCDIKNTPEYQKQLWETAKGDAHHDLSEVFKPTDYSNAAHIREAFNQGLPTINSSSIKNLTEDTCLSSIILTIGNIKVSNLKD